MRGRTGRATGLALILAALLAVAPWAIPAATPEGESETTKNESMEGAVQDELGKQLAERRKAMMQEAADALDETNVALNALDEGKKKEAIDALARATGKLELLVAREPTLALAPFDVSFATHDLYASPSAVRAARNEVEELLDDGKVQQARSLLSVLASEIVISVSHLPLATYPDAIKAITPLIDEGKVEEAKEALHAALNTIVVTNKVISLPVVRAEGALEQAEALIGQEELSDEDKKMIDELVDLAREQLEIAEVLGYGARKDHQQYRDSIAELEERIHAGRETTGVFAKLRKSLDEYRASFFE